MTSPLDHIKRHQAEAAAAQARERGEKSQESIDDLYEAYDRYVRYVSDNDYKGLDIIAFDATLGTEEYAGKTFVFSGTVPAPSSIAIVFKNDGTPVLLNDQGAGGVVKLPAGSRLPSGGTLDYPVSVLPVDQGEDAIFNTPLESGLQRRRWIEFNEAIFTANNTPQTIGNVTKSIDRDYIRIKALVEAEQHLQ